MAKWSFIYLYEMALHFYLANSRFSVTSGKFFLFVGINDAESVRAQRRRWGHSPKIKTAHRSRTAHRSLFVPRELQLLSKSDDFIVSNIDIGSRHNELANSRYFSVPSSR